MDQSIEPERLAACFDAHAPALRLYARQFGPGVDADDLVQDAFVALARQTVAPREVAAWLYRVVRNRAVSASRTHRRRDRRESCAARREAWFDTTDDRIDADTAAQTLAELPMETRSVVVARLWGGLTFEQIGQAEGCSVAAAHRRYQAGLRSLAVRLGEPTPCRD